MEKVTETSKTLPSLNTAEAYYSRMSRVRAMKKNNIHDETDMLSAVK